MKHIHTFKARHAHSTVATCHCGAFQFTKFGLATLPHITAQEAPKTRKQIRRNLILSTLCN